MAVEVQKPQTKKVLNPTVIRLGIVSFFTDISSEMLYPITPIFLTSILGASMASLGFVEGVAESIASLLKTYSGTWSDSIAKRKPFVVIGYFLSALSKPLIGLSQSWTHVLISRSTDKTGKGIRTAPRDAMIAESVESHHIGEAFGWHRAMDTLGAAVGPLFAILFLSYRPDELRPLYFWAIIPGLMAVAIILTINESSPAKTNTTAQKLKFENPFKIWSQTTAHFKKFILAWGIFAAVNSSDVFLLMKCKTAGFSTVSVILIYCFFNLVYAFSSPFFGKLSDQINRRKLLIFGLFAFALVYLGFAFANQAWQYWVLFCIYGLYMGATEGVSKALAVDFSDKNLKATGIGILGTVTGLCTIIASLSAGLLWDNFGSHWAFVFGAVGALISAIVMKCF